MSLIADAVSGSNIYRNDPGMVTVDDILVLSFRIIRWHPMNCYGISQIVSKHPSKYIVTSRQ